MKHANSLDTAADHLFRQKPQPKRSGWWKWVLALILAALFVYRSTRPVTRLSAEPPPSFFDYNRAWSPQERQQERRVALAYWHVAVRRIQKHYSSKTPLPATPPAQFRISDAAKTMESDVVAARGHYWYRLREVWRERDAWVVSHGWNTGWVTDSLVSLRQYIPHSVAGVLQGLVDLFSDIAQKISYP